MGAYSASGYQMMDIKIYTMKKAKVKGEINLPKDEYFYIAANPKGIKVIQ